jgi:hemerythrin
MEVRGLGLQKLKIVEGVYWLSAPAAGLKILCGCPPDAVKHLIKHGLIAPIRYKKIAFETGPNAILLSDRLLQNGQFSNLSEFPVLQMLYRQGMILPDHPNNTGLKPLLIGSKNQVDAQMAYIYRGNYGLVSIKELLGAGLDPKTAQQFMRIKLKFAFGQIRQTEELLDSCVVDQHAVEIRNGLFIKRIGFNLFEFRLGQEKVTVDLNLNPDANYTAPFNLGSHQIQPKYFAVIHSGEGDGWDVKRPCMGSILMFKGKIYLIDVAPNIRAILTGLNIKPSEVEGIFHTHAHDDHFAGLPAFMLPGHKIKYYTTQVVRASVTKKLAALMSIKERTFGDYFDYYDLDPDHWNDINGLEVKPIFSPHPVETNIFKFRTLGNDSYRSYAHLADIASQDVLKDMVTDDPSENGISQKYCKQIMSVYRKPVDLKKIDIGGDLIHGNAIDFKDDTSKKIALAHKASPLTREEKTIGQNMSFGDVDVLIDA